MALLQKTRAIQAETYLINTRPNNARNPGATIPPPRACG